MLDRQDTAAFGRELARAREEKDEKAEPINRVVEFYATHSRNA